MKLPDFDRIPNISPMWWGAIASAAAAGAILFPDSRIVGGAAAGGALLVLALYKTPCCASCAGAAKPAPVTAATAPNGNPGIVVDMARLVASGGPYGASGCAS